MMRYFLLFLGLLNAWQTLQAQDAEQYFREGLAQMEAGQYASALEKLDQAIQQDDKKDSFKYASRGMTYYKMEDYRKALSDYKQSIKINASNPDFYFQKGIVEDSLQRYPDALQSFGKAIKLDPENAQYYISRAHIYSVNKDYTVSLANLNYAVQLDENNAMAYYLRGIAKYNLVDSKGSCEDFQKAIELEYLDAKTWLEKYCQ